MDGCIIFRADASLAIGSGHVMRCLNLAEGLRSHGATVSFISREHEGNLNAQIARRGFALLALPAPQAGNTSPLGAPWQEDAQQCAELLDVPQDLLVTDHYSIDYRWHQIARPLASRIMAIDDLADRRHDCDLLLDQNLSDEGNARYDGLAPADCVRLIGPRYALLQPQYASLHEQCLPRQGLVRRILLFFGSADPGRLCSRALQAVLDLKRPEITVDVVAGIASADLDAIRSQAAAHPQVHVHCGLPSLAPLMVKADLAVGAGGVTSWERLCLGLPSIVVTVADNQIPVTRLLARRGLVQWVGDTRQAGVAALGAALRQWCDTGIPVGWFPDYRDLVDGRGVARVCAALMGSGGEDMQ